MSDPALVAARLAIRAAHQRVDRVYKRLQILTAGGSGYISGATAAELRDAANALLLAVTELEVNRPIGGTIHEPPEAA